MIKLENINKTYTHQQASRAALKQVNLVIHPGQIVGIIGESGAGKSTLLRTINLLERPTTGKIFINGTDITGLSKEALRQFRRKIGMIFQHFHLLHSRTVYENIALPLELAHVPAQEIEQEVARLLEMVKLTGHAQHYPEQLSGGQKQRVAIARALATKPEILLCDEPTSALDSKSTQSILNLLKEINGKLQITIVLITHELNVIKQICDTVGVMHDGEILEYESVVNLFTQPQTTPAKELIEKSLHMALPAEYATRLHPSLQGEQAWLVKLTFLGDENSSQPLISNLIKEFGITISIIQANIEHVQETTIGFTVCLISGAQQQITAALNAIPQQSVKVEVLGYV